MNNGLTSVQFYFDYVDTNDKLLVVADGISGAIKPRTAYNQMAARLTKKFPGMSGVFYKCETPEVYEEYVSCISNATVNTIKVEPLEGGRWYVKAMFEINHMQFLSSIKGDYMKL